MVTEILIVDTGEGMQGYDYNCTCMVYIENYVHACVYARVPPLTGHVEVNHIRQVHHNGSTQYSHLSHTLILCTIRCTQGVKLKCGGAP